jgi:ribose-phosphate pyrophosphokinase
LKKLLFATNHYQYLKEKMLATSPLLEAGELEVKNFPDGERYMRIRSDVSGREVLILGGTVSDSDTLEIYDLACAAVKYGAISLTLIIPYFGYSTMERAVQYGEVVTAKTRAMLFSSIPRTSLGNKVILIDLHTEGIPHYFESGIVPIHLYSKSIIHESCEELYGKDFVLASTDAGRAKWVESLANDMHVEGAFVFKRRISGDETKVTGISADVKNKNVIIYDDMIRTGGSLIQAAKSYKEAGANEISVITTHGIFVGNGIEKMRNSEIINTVVCTDTHPNSQLVRTDFIKVKSVARLLVSKVTE